QMMSALGFDMPSGATVIEPRAMSLAFGIGLIVTVLSAWLPARRAAKIAPIAAMRELSVDRSASSGLRAMIGAVMTCVGVASVVSGNGNLVAIGALVTFAGVIVVAPVLTRPVASVLGLLLRTRGLRGELATKNAVRNPKRTAGTAASLTIGVALVAFMTVFAASTKTSLAGSIDREFKGTHIVQTGGTDTSSGLSPLLAAALRSTPGVDEVSESRLMPAVIDGVTTNPLYGFEGATVDDMIAFDRLTGDLGSLGPDGIAVSEKYAADRGWTIGTVVPATLPSGDTAFVVKAIYAGGTDWVGQVFVDLEAMRANGGENLDYQLYVSGDRTAIEQVAAAYPSAVVLDKHEFLAVVSSDIDTMLAMFYALLMLAVVIALLGIANTLSLSIFERTRELGVLRAMGMGRAQVRSTVRWESIIIALFGAVLGLSLGTFFGWAVVRTLADEGIDTLDIPIASLAAIAGIGAVSGALAAVMPARRAAKLDVLQALAAA
ncbi:MAG: FtsX-like permease family protein, partial [Ilumatobacteraceae bacterium]